MAKSIDVHPESVAPPPPTPAGGAVRVRSVRLDDTDFARIERIRAHYEGILHGRIQLSVSDVVKIALAAEDTRIGRADPAAGENASLGPTI